MNNDAKITELLKSIETKKSQLGAKPKARWLTNGIIVVDGTTHNINTINTINKCVEIVASILNKTKNVKEAQELLGVCETNTFSDLEDTVTDLKLKCSIIKYDLDLSTINKLEKQLKDLRSEDAKTADAISDIEAFLNS